MASYNYVTVSGTFPTLTGTVTFTPPPQVTDVTGAMHILGPGTFTCTVSGGSFTSPPLLATDNVGLLPAGWDYTTTVTLAGQNAYSYPVLVPSANGTAATLSSLPVAASGFPSTTGDVTSVTATDPSISVTGTAQAPTIATGALDVIATRHPPAANWSNNSHKITSLADPGSGADAATMRYTQALVSEAPADRGMIAWTFSPASAVTEIALSGLVGNTGHPSLTKVWLRQTQTVTNIMLPLGNAVGSGLTTGQNFAGMYNSGGSLVAVTADQTTAWTTSANANTTLAMAVNGGTPASLPAGFYWVALMANGGTAPLIGYLAGNSSIVNFGLTAATCYAGFWNTSSGSLPTTITPASISIGHGSSFPILSGIS